MLGTSADRPRVSSAPHGQLFGFEPEADNYRALLKNTRDLPNCIPVNFAVSNKSAILTLRHSSHSSCHSLVATQSYLDGDHFDVPATTLDDFWRQHLDERQIAVLKVDVEGAELLVLGGMTEICERRALHTMVIEYCPQIMRNAGSDPGELYRLLANHFRIEILEQRHRRATNDGRVTSESDFTRLTEHLVAHDHPQNVNLLCSSGPE